MNDIIDQLLDAGSAFRLERKYVVDTLSMAEVICQLQMHPACFSTIYYPRAINNIYFDAIDQDAYWANVDGRDERVKARIRWYGATFGMIEKPVLELKIKRGICNYKLNYPLQKFALDESWNMGFMMKIFQTSDLPAVLIERLKELDVAVLNSYHRQYFQSHDRKYRVTLDDQLCFYRLQSKDNTFLAKTTIDDEIIVELKYDVPADQQATTIALELPFRLIRHSKFVRGVQHASLEGIGF